jgi:diaminopimelate epimerase
MESLACLNAEPGFPMEQAILLSFIHSHLIWLWPYSVQVGFLLAMKKQKQLLKANEKLAINGRSFNVTCLSIGNPHCVVLLDDISRELAEDIGPIIENHALFPNRINVQMLKVLDRNNIQIEIWERGAGYTLASGSSSCAAASAAYKLGLVAEDINVHMPGGAINVKIDQDGRVRMTGSVTGVCKGVFMDDLSAQIMNLSGL